jgi:hypothetical protein
MLEQLGSKDFAARLHTVFRVEEPAVLDLEMTEVVDRSNAQLEQFSVLFKGPESPWLQQGIYALKHPRMGELSLFMVPLGPREGGMIYQAVFSRLIAASRTPA